MWWPDHNSLPLGLGFVITTDRCDMVESETAVLPVLWLYIQIICPHPNNQCGTLEYLHLKSYSHISALLFFIIMMML